MRFSGSYSPSFFPQTFFKLFILFSTDYVFQLHHQFKLLKLCQKKGHRNQDCRQRLHIDEGKQSLRDRDLKQADCNKTPGGDPTRAAESFRGNGSDNESAWMAVMDGGE